METGRILGGRYKIEGRIGSGGMSTVYKAHEIELDREVAVKVLISTLSDDPQLVERFNREAKTIASLQHNAIIPIYYYGIEDDLGSYLVMPMLKGGTLEQRLHQLEMLPSLTEVGELADRLGNALQYAHDKGVVHRDIKFSNIMFDDAGSPYIMDFGIAKLLNTTNLTGTGMTVGTPNFMPPEQWRNDDITPAVDQYAFAVLMFAMLTRRMPFEADTAPALMYQHLQEVPPLASEFREDVPVEMENAIHRALSKEPGDRFPTIAEFTRVISQTALATTRKYSGFFKAPIENKTQRTPTTGMQQQRIMPNTPTAMVAEGQLDGAKTTISNEASPKKDAQEEESGGVNQVAFFGGMFAVVVIGALIIGGLFFRNQQMAALATEETQTAVAIAGATETVIAFDAQVASDATDTEVANINATETREAEPTATNTATDTPEPTATSTETPEPTASNTATDTSEPTDTATNTATNTPDTTVTQRSINQTATAEQQGTENALLRLTASAIAIFQTERAEDDATATQRAEDTHGTETENAVIASTATSQAGEILTQQANFEATSTAQSENMSSTTVAMDRNSTATAFAVVQAEFDSTATQIAVIATESALNANPIEYGVAIVEFGLGEESIEWSFEAETGDVISLVARGIDFDPVIELYLGNRFITADEDSGYRDNARIENLRIEEDGLYRLVLRDQSGDEISGEYSVGITDMERCPGELAPRILVGDFARVTLDGLRNNVRINPTTDSSRVVQIPNGDVFLVLQGPRCNDSFTWYRVDYDGAVGWTAEADDEEYWLELLPEDDEPVLLAGGEGLTNGQELEPGEMQVESFCLARGLDATTDTIDWYCQNGDGVIITTLVEEDFDELCQSTYDEEEAFARQDGPAPEPAYQWLCYYYPQ